MRSKFKEIEELKQTYNSISSSYLSKKSEPWHELVKQIPEVYNSKPGILLDVGCGNGRNLQNIGRTMVIGLDFSESLLRNFVLDAGTQRILGSATHLPMRSQSVSEIISIAVIHHLPDNPSRISAILENERCLEEFGICIITVWRKWRSGLKSKLLKRVRNRESITDLVDDNRPWKDSQGNILGYRFYHYYTWKELYFQVAETNFEIIKRKIMGGKDNNDNFLVKLQHI